MNLLNLTTSDYPCSLWQVRQANPNVSFTAEPTDEDLAQFGYANVYPTPQLSYDQRTERIEEVIPEPDADGVYRQQWLTRLATDEEIAAYDLAHRPTPEWGNFKAALLASEAINAVLASALSVAPAAALALPATLMAIAEGRNADDFWACWNALRGLDLVPQLTLDQAATFATDCHLPADFISSLVGSANDSGTL